MIFSSPRNKRPILWTTVPAATLCLAMTVAFPGLAAAQTKKTPAKQAPAAKLTNKEFPDGTGTIGLPAGWSIDGSYRGTVFCDGPARQKIIMGHAFVIGRPDHPANNQGIPVTYPLVPDGDLVEALKGVIGKGNSRLISLRSRPAPSPGPGIPASYFLYELDSGGKRIVVFGYFSAITDSDQTLPYWQLYSSAVMTPKETFMKDLPTLMAIWNSYHPNGSKPREGSMGAMIDEVNKDRMKRRQQTLKEQQEAFDRMNDRFKTIIKE